MELKIGIKMLVIFISILFSTMLIGQNQLGSIKGKVFNRETKEPIIGANIIILGTQLGAATDFEGAYIIKNIPFGNYELKCMFIGFVSNLDSIIVTKNNPTIVKDLSMEEFEFLEPTYKDTLIKGFYTLYRKGYSFIPCDSVDCISMEGFHPEFWGLLRKIGQGDKHDRLTYNPTPFYFELKGKITIETDRVIRTIHEICKSHFIIEEIMKMKIPNGENCN